jgi:hypothetical protein
VTVVEANIRRPPDRCWSRFVDARLLASWVPGLRRAKVVRQDPEGMPLEVLFEFSETLSYSLIYRYDADLRRVAWLPGVGKKDAVSGFAEFAEEGEGTRMTYALQPGARGENDLQGNAQRVVEAFVKFVENGK